MAFDYLIILLALITGLAMTNVLTAWARLIHLRGTVRIYIPSLIWSAWVFVACVEHWWSKYSVRTVEHWTFAGFFALLLTPIALYLLSELVLPPRGELQTVSQEAWFDRNRRWFYAIVAAIIPLSYVEEYLVSGTIKKDPLEHVLLGVLLAIALAGIFLRGRMWQYVISIVVALLTIVYIALLFNALPT